VGTDEALLAFGAAWRGAGAVFQLSAGGDLRGGGGEPVRRAAGVGRGRGTAGVGADRGDGRCRRWGWGWRSMTGWRGRRRRGHDGGVRPPCWWRACLFMLGSGTLFPIMNGFATPWGGLQLVAGVLGAGVRAHHLSAGGVPAAAWARRRVLRGGRWCSSRDR
jgi:hypothetical protein